MKTAYRWVILFLLLCSVSVSAKEPRALERPAPEALRVSVIVDGVHFAPEEMDQFAGQTLYYVLDRAAEEGGVLHAFTSLQGERQYIESLAAERIRQRSGELTASMAAICSDARFNKVPGGTGVSWLLMYCGQTISTLDNVSGDWNNRISYVEASGSWTVLYTCHYFSMAQGCERMAIQGGVTISDLTPYNFNNRVSSIKVCPEGITFTECLGF